MTHVNYATDESSEKSGMTSIMAQKKMRLFEVPKGVLPFLLYLVRFSLSVLYQNCHRKRVTLAGMSRRKKKMSHRLTGLNASSTIKSRI